MFDVRKVRSHFPIFDGENSDLAFLDSAASSQKPRSVIDRMAKYYSYEHANVHRGVYDLSENATREFEEARNKVAKFLGVQDSSEIIFTRGTTEAINLVAMTWGKANLKPGDEILLTVAEHHSNIVPWQMVAEQTGARLVFLPLGFDFRIDSRSLGSFFNRKTKLVSIAHVSNVLGVKHPIEEIGRLARAHGAVFFIDGAQGVVHHDIDLAKIQCDFYAFSGHKLLGPTGIGVLWGKKELLNSMPPYQGGGDMIEKVTLDGSTWADLPNKFEAGTPHIAGAIGLGTAIDYMNELDRQEARKWEKHLGEIAVRELKKNSNIQLFVHGGDDWCGIVTFRHKLIHPHDLASVASSHKVCIRAGHHCAQPLMSVLNVSATCRISPFIYNTEADIDRFIYSVKKAEQLFG